MEQLRTIADSMRNIRITISDLLDTGSDGYREEEELSFSSDEDEVNYVYSHCGLSAGCFTETEEKTIAYDNAIEKLKGIIELLEVKRDLIKEG